MGAMRPGAGRSTRLYVTLAMATLVSCKKESPCQGYDDCPMDVPLSMGAAPCCCGDEFVDEAILSGEGWETADGQDTAGGSCWGREVTCYSTSGLTAEWACDD